MNDDDDDVDGQQEDVRKRSEPGGTSQEKASAPNDDDTVCILDYTMHIAYRHTDYFTKKYNLANICAKICAPAALGPFYAFEGVDQSSGLNKTGKTARWEKLQSQHGGEKPKAGKYFKVNTDSKETAQNFILSHPEYK